jgi:DNA-binding CsgD family transcriptional regulator
LKIGLLLHSESMPNFNFYLYDIKLKKLLRKLIPPGILILILFLIDISFDIHQSIEPKHIAIELLIYIVAFYIGTIVYRFYKLEKKTIKDVQTNLSESNSEIKYWQEQNKALIEGLSKKIHEEFEQWGLSQAETHVALLIIKGFSLEEIASLRGTSGRTIRDQAASVYRKAKLKNRIELSAYFFEELLSPIHTEQ